MNTKQIIANTQMDIHEVLEYLPHRYPFLLIDRVLSYEVGKEITALKNVTINEPFFGGHFPHHPVMPGVLIVEAMAQATAILTFKTTNTKPNDKLIYYFVGIDGARFKKPVMAGDQLVINVKLLRAIRGMWKLAGTVTVDGQVVTEAELLCTVREL
ncbi:MAG: 3-hydroxyacyl-ACP dehydratase FabZ [Candidatus Nitrotoga sp.]